MAEMPVEARPPGPASLTVPGANFLRAAAGMPMVRQLTLLSAIAGSVAIAVVAVLWMQSADYRPVTGVTSAYQANEVVGVLSGANIPHRIDEHTGMILVPGDLVYEARMKLAGASGVDSRQLGYELLDADQGFGVSQFMELARHRRSIEGELARSIATITSIESARVLLATPKSTTFLRDQRKPTASVTVKLLPAQDLSPAQVRGIANLVAGAVPEMDPDHVAVIDQSGRLLSAGANDPELEQSERQLAYIARIESQLQDKIGKILSPTVGQNRFSAQVSAEIDFTRTEQTEELYNPDLLALRSEQTSDEENVGEVPVAGVPGTLTNQPPETQPTQAGIAAQEQTVNRRSRSQATRNYEVDRTISHTQHAVGALSRLTVSVVVDDTRVTDAETGENSDQPWSAEELQRLTTLVQSAVGFSASRGDIVSVVNSRFFDETVDPIEAPPFWTESWFFDLLKQVVGALVLMFLVLGLLRPLFRNLSQAGEIVKERQSLAHNLALTEMSSAGGVALKGNAGALPGPAAGALTHRVAGSHDAQLDTVRGLVQEDPARVAQVVKHWVSNDE